MKEESWDRFLLSQNCQDMVICSPLPSPAASVGMVTTPGRDLPYTSRNSYTNYESHPRSFLCTLLLLLTRIRFREDGIKFEGDELKWYIMPHPCLTSPWHQHPTTFHSECTDRFFPSEKMLIHSLHRAYFANSYPDGIVKDIYDRQNLLDVM